MSLDQWTVVASGNGSIATGINFAEGQAPSTLNDSARQLMADLRAEQYQSATVVAAGSTDLSTATGSYVPISGNTTITGLGTMSAGIERKLLFTGAPLIVYNATSNILPGAANIQAAAGDKAHVISEGGGNWRWLDYMPASFKPYLTSSYTGTLTGCTTSPTATIKYTIIGNQCTIDVPTGFTGTSNATSKTITGAPAAIFPSANKTFSFRASDNSGGYVWALGVLGTNGVLTFSATADAGNWTGSGTATIDRFTFTYLLT